MENVAAQKEQTGVTPSVAHALWDPFWLMREMFGWAHSGAAPSLAAKETVDTPPFFDVTESDGAYVCKFKMTLPNQADLANVKAEFKNGELTLLVPKAATPKPASPPPRTRGTRGNGRRSAAARKPHGGAPRKRRA